VVKFDPYAYIFDVGGVACQTGPYRPAVLTDMNDDTVGETIPGSSGSPSAVGAFIVMSSSMTGSTTGIVVHDVRFCYMDFGIGWYSESSGSYYLDLWNCQFLDCTYGINLDYGLNLGLHNVLFTGPTAVITSVGVDLGGDYSVKAEQVTADVSEMGLASPSPSWMTNSIVLESSGPTATIIGNSVITTSPTLPIFQTVGAGSYYLATNSVYRDAGTTNISSLMRAELGQKTTYPPLVYSNTTMSVTTSLSPQVQRDSDIPDLGYHYDPLDYAFGGVNVYSNLTFTAGTAIGYFELPGSGGTGYGISIYDHVILALNGTVSQPCTVARYSTVQEGGNGLWKDKGYLAAIAGQSLSGGYSMNANNAAQVWPNFTRHAALAADPNHYREYNALLKVVGQNSEFWSANLGAYWMYYDFTNCLFDRAGFFVQGSNPAQCALRNCTLHGGTVILEKYGGTWPVWVEECAFDGTSLTVDDNSSGNTNITYCDFNAFLTNANRLPMHGTHDVTNLVSYYWQSSWLGNFYEPTNSPLIDHGSTTADQFGLYHFTTQTNQVKETNSVVDIGYHYVALNTNGVPLDSNGDGIPDYIEDANGDGIFDSGDLGEWKISPFGLGGANKLQVFTPLK
jgi:hypothetical protein